MVSDPWDQPQSSASPTGPQIPPATRRPATAPVPDDWENDDDDDEPENEQNNQRVWDDANAKLPTPMPSLILSSNSNSSRTIVSPPPGAFQAPMRILKRPTSTPSPNPVISSSSSSETLQDREARYLKARERIFGEEDAESRGDSAPFPSSTSSSSKKLENDPSTNKSRIPPVPIPNLKNPAAVVSVLRNPRGPSDWPDENEQANTDGNTSPRGFGGRRTNPPSKEGVIVQGGEGV